MMPNKVFTIVTFAPVQGFIENSRKLRDLYGSSFIISCLSRTICDAAEEDGYTVVSPAIINLTQGTPNQIIIEGDTAFPSKKAEEAFNSTWQKLVKGCRIYIEDELPNYDYHWQRNWNAWANYAWEFFCVEGEPGDTITDVRQKLNEIKRRRNWIGINWVGESSTLSGYDAVAWYGMTDQMNPKTAKMGEIDKKIEDFYKDLSNNLMDTIIDENEQLSIPELVKRLVTLYPVKKELKELGENLENLIELPDKFTDLNRKTQEENYWTGWFQGDGDSIGKYFKSLIKQGKDERDSLRDFSEAMIKWGQNFEKRLPAQKEVRTIYSDKNPPEGRIIYAGGDDFLGVLYRNDNPPLTLDECLPWLYHFPTIWNQHKQPITVSMGFVWAAGGVPQRDVLQHCKLAEQSAKKQGRDRLVIRILYSSGNYIEWGCPWWWFQELLESYQDRDGDSIKSLKNYPKINKNNPNWTHFYNDVLALESRHAFKGNQIDIALEIFEIYFGEENRMKLENSEYWWNEPKENYLWNNPDSSKTMGLAGETGILGEKETYYNEQQEIDYKKINQDINDWVINLAKVGFRIFQSSNNKSLPSVSTPQCA